MVDFFLAAFLVLIIGGAIVYIVRAKKRGVKCIGCSAGGNCSCGDKKETTCNCGCGGTGTEQ